jgi:hypothetical protein
MESYHDPVCHINFLKSVLALDKKPVGFLISAGCPYSIKDNGNPLMPDIKDLSKDVNTEMAKAEAQLKADYETIVSDLKAEKAEGEGKDAKKKKEKTETKVKDDVASNSIPNIEKILSRVRAIKVVAGSKGIGGITKERLINLEEKICEVIVSKFNKPLPETDNPYQKFAAWVSSVERDSPIEVFTTNYDLLLEQAFERLCVPYFDGFVGSYRTFFDIRAIEEDVLPSRWVRLWKLHGSINWFQDKANQGDVYRGIFEKDKNCYLIHPSHLKFDESRKMPYLAMSDRLRSFLKQTSVVLFICGYSFNDEHINHVILQGLQANPKSMIFALLFGKLEDYPWAISIAEKKPNLSLFAFDGGIIGTKKGVWKINDANELDATHKKLLNLITPESKEVTPGEKNAKVTDPLPELYIGNFVCFGDFLQAIIGESYFQETNLKHTVEVKPDAQ